MNKIVIREFDRKFVIVDILFYSVFAILGFMLLGCSSLAPDSSIMYGPFLFYTLAFFSLIAYFVNRRKDDYEYLLFGFINVVTATFVLIYTTYPDSGFILSDAVLLYSIANVLNKGFSCARLLEKKDFNFFPKAAVTILLLLIGVFVVGTLYNRVEAGITILGYYFLIYGLLSLLEPLNSILLENKALKTYLISFLSYDSEEDQVKQEEVEVKEEPKVEEVVKEEIVEPAKEEKPKVKRTTTRKTTAKKTTTKKATTKKTTTKKATTKKTTTRKSTKKTK